MISVHPMTPCMTPDVPRRVDGVMRVVAGRRIAGVIVCVLLGIWCMRAGKMRHGEGMEGMGILVSDEKGGYWLPGNGLNTTA